MKVAALILLLAIAPALLAVSALDGGATAPTIEIRYSRFAPEVVTIRAGVPVTFTLRNEDPIAHEWIVGTAAVHERHRVGNEPYHDHLPTEVTVPALATRTTTLTFEKSGDYAFICHLPGHEAYGMRGTLQVVAQ